MPTNEHIFEPKKTLAELISKKHINMEVSIRECGEITCTSTAANPIKSLQKCLI